MKIKILKRSNKKIKNFQEKEWKIADIEHYGRPTDYTKKKFKIVAEDEKKRILGFCGLEIQTEMACIDTLIVKNDVRKKGIGRQLVLEAEKIAKNLNCYKIWLTTGEDWESVKFYQVLGYQITGRLEKHRFGQDFLIFTKFFKKE